MKRRRSITVRIAVWFTFILVVLVLLTYLVFRIVSASILQKTVRGYLMGSVNENSDKIGYLTDAQRQTGTMYIFSTGTDGSRSTMTISI